MNFKKTLAAIGSATIALSMLAGVASAAPSDQAACRQAAGDLFVASSTEGTRGDFMSDVIFGNEPNMANGAVGGPNEQEPGTQAGNVLPSQSPGPFVNNPNDPENPTFGFTGGDLQELVRSACNS